VDFPAAAGVAVSLGLTGGRSTGGAGNDTPSGFDALRGSAFNDSLTGGTGNDNAGRRPGAWCRLAPARRRKRADIADRTAHRLLVEVERLRGAGVASPKAWRGR
jgi:hypothetical protein